MVLHQDPNALDPRGGPATGDALPAWAPYDADRRPTLVIDADARMVDDPVGEVRRLWGDAPWPSGTWWAY